MGFLDLFSQHAEIYAAFRPTYPPALFEYLASTAPSTHAVWDCATGNGQAAEGLARHFQCVIATDASKKQIAQARRNDRIHYCVALAENAPLQSASVDLVTVAQALHWLNPDLFFSQVNRVLKSGGIAAVWCYTFLEVDPDIDSLLLHFYKDIVGPYWAPERRLLEMGYQTMPFPFEEFSAPPIFMENDWNLYDLAGYLATWSATQQYIRVNGADPVPEIIEQISKFWGDASASKHIRWPLSIRIGRKQRNVGISICG